MRFFVASLIFCVGFIGAQPLGAFNRPMMNQPSPILAGAAAANNPFNQFNQFNQLNNPAAGFPLMNQQQPVLSAFNQPLPSGMNQRIVGLNAFNNPLAQQPASPQQAFPQQQLPQQNLMQQPIVGATPQVGGLNAIGLADQQIQQLALQAAQPTLNQWLSSDHQTIFQRAGALNNAPLNQPIMGGSAPSLQGVQAIQGLPNTLAALQQQMQQPFTQNLLQSNPNLAQWIQQQQLAMQQAVAAPPVGAVGAAPQQFQIPGNSPVGQFQVDQGPLTGANPPMMQSMQSRPSNPPNMNQPILQGAPIQQQQSSPLQQFNAPNPPQQDFTLAQPASIPQPAQPNDPQRPGTQPILHLNQAAQTSLNPSGPQPLAPQAAPMMNAPRRP